MTTSEDASKTRRATTLPISTPFEEWMARPVYVAQCKTAQIARRMCGFELPPGQGLMTVMGQDDGGLSHLRVFAQYRSAQGQSLRNAVAQVVKAQRLLQRQTKAA